MPYCLVAGYIVIVIMDRVIMFLIMWLGGYKDIGSFSKATLSISILQS